MTQKRLDEIKARCEAGKEYQEYESPPITYQDCREMLAEIERLRALTTWIPCSERMPEDEDLILAYHPNYVIPAPGQESHNVDRITIKFGWYCRQSALGITHWMPLPEMPEVATP